MFIIPFSNISEQELLELANKKLSENTEEWEAHIWSFIALWYDKNVGSVEVFSSGSTGKPKAVLHSKICMAAHAKMTCETMALQTEITSWLCLPANKIGGMMMIVRCIVNRMDLLCTKPAARPFEALEKEHSVVFAALTPMQMKSATGASDSYTKMNCIQNILLGGEAVDAELISYLNATKNNIYSTFGMTETISHIALKKINGVSPDKFFKTLYGISVSTDNRGCLVINAPELNINNLVTNDLVELKGETEFNWLGRIDNVINTGGIKVLAEEIERRLEPFIGLPFFIAGIANELTGEKVVLVLEANHLSEQTKQQLLSNFQAIHKYEKPKAIFLSPKFITTENGKIKRKETLLQAIEHSAFSDL